MDVITYGAAVGAAKKYTDEHSGSDDAVKYTEQSLTDAQKTQARQNIGASDGDYRNLTNAPPLVKGNGTGGNTIGGTGINTNSARFANSVAYGNIVSADANYAFAFGERAFAGKYPTGKHAVAIGNNVWAKKDYEFAYGKFNQSNDDTAFSFGDGTSDNDRHNLMEIKTDGRMFLNGNAVKTEGGDDNKLRLGQICGMKFSTGTTGYHTFNDGFSFLFDSINSITFTSDTSAGVVGSATVYQFGDFVGYINSNAVIVRPIRGKLDYPTTGQWIKVENGYSMFAGVSTLRTLSLSMFDTSEVKNMEQMFSGCTAITSLDLSSFDTSEVENMTYMFYRCTALTNLDISSFDMTNVIAYDKMFGEESHWAGITTLKTPKINPHDDIPLPRTLYSQDGTAYTNLPVTTGTSIELRRSWT